MRGAPLPIAALMRHRVSSPIGGGTSRAGGVAVFAGAVALTACLAAPPALAAPKVQAAAATTNARRPTLVPVPTARPGATTDTLVAAALAQIGRTTQYDPAYVKLKYPGGDVPMDRGVCTDVLIRAFRGVGIDLQVAVHEDMARNFRVYPRYGNSHADANIDHRRVHNLEKFFARIGASARVTHDPADYLPGDIVMWSVDGLAHTGLVSAEMAEGTDRPLMVHNIGWGTQLEDMLFEYPVTNHFRFPLPRNS
jgi:uncharacterized protein YijF (DUF1287 family)